MALQPLHISLKLSDLIAVRFVFALIGTDMADRRCQRIDLALHRRDVIFRRELRAEPHQENGAEPAQARRHYDAKPIVQRPGPWSRSGPLGLHPYASLVSDGLARPYAVRA